MSDELRKAAKAIAESNEMLDIGVREIDATLVELRDSRSSIYSQTGLVCAEADGNRSDVIRLTPRQALYIAMRAIADAKSASDMSERAKPTRMTFAGTAPSMADAVKEATRVNPPGEIVSFRVEKMREGEWAYILGYLVPPKADEESERR